MEELEKRVADLMRSSKESKESKSHVIAEIGEKELVRVGSRPLGKGGFKVAWLCQWKAVSVVLLQLNEVCFRCCGAVPILIRV